MREGEAGSSGPGPWTGRAAGYGTYSKRKRERKGRNSLGGMAFRAGVTRSLCQDASRAETGFGREQGRLGRWCGPRGPWRVAAWERPALNLAVARQPRLRTPAEGRMLLAEEAGTDDALGSYHAMLSTAWTWLQFAAILS